MQQELALLLEKVQQREGASFEYSITPLHVIEPTNTASSAPVVTEISTAIEQVLGRPATEVRHAQYTVTPAAAASINILLLCAINIP